MFSPVTDKVSFHRLGDLYDRSLSAMRKRSKLRVLEIGLGCQRPEGPGVSAPVWLEYFREAQVELYLVDIDGPCVESWNAEVVNDMQRYKQRVGGSWHKQSSAQAVHFDQANATMIHRFLRTLPKLDNGALFDLIVDDGGHTERQMRVSFETLFDTLCDGGVYVIEDLYFQNEELFDPTFFPVVLRSFNVTLSSTSDEIKRKARDLRNWFMKDGHSETFAIDIIRGVMHDDRRLGRSVSFVSCYTGTCAFERGQRKTLWSRWDDYLATKVDLNERS